MKRGQLFLAGSLTAVAISAVLVVQLHNPTSWLSRRIDGATTLPAGVPS